jgi:UDP-glucose 4-epimerase
LHRAEFHRIDPRDRTRAADVIKAFAPSALVHLGVYEPFARSSPKSAIERTANGTVAALTAAAWAGKLDRIVVRSGIEIYGRRRGAPRCPDEDVQPDPTSPFGHVLLHTERVVRDTAFQVAAPATLLRFAPLVGPHFPSPLGRYLRLPVLPFSALGDPTFSVLHQEDAARTIVAAVHQPFDGPVNVVGEGSVTTSQAARIGARVPLPILRPAWRPTSLLSELLGSPSPEHIIELLTRGRTGEGWR